MHQEWTDQLSAYLDDDLGPDERRAVDAHLVACAPCRHVLAQLRAVVAWAPDFVGVEPAADLWPGVARGIDTSRNVAFPARAGARFSLVQMAAAAVLVAVVSGGGVWLLVDRAGPPVVAVPPTASAPGVVTSTASVEGDAAYHAAVVELEQVLQAGRGQLDTATVRIIEDNLRVIDVAIEEARAAIAAGPSNAYLAARIRSNMQRKLVLLRQAARATGAAS